MTLTAPSARRRQRAAVLVAALAAGSGAILAGASLAAATPGEPPHAAELDEAIIRAAHRHGVPEHLVRRIVMRESRYNPRARNHSFWGLMQISYPTARSMGFRGTPEQLLNPVTNLTYAVPYLANAFIIAGRREDAAVRLYASGYYAAAKSRGVLGVLRTADSKPLNGVAEEPTDTPMAAAAADGGSNWNIFGSASPAAAPAVAPPPAPQQLAYAAAPSGVAPAQAQIDAVARPAPTPPARAVKISDKNADDGVAMVAQRDGAMAPPRRWQRDGGVSMVMRGEQGLEHVAAYRLGPVAAPARSRKSTVFAQLDPPGAVAAQPAGETPTSAFYATAAAPAPEPAAQASQQTVAANQAAAAPADADATDRPRHRRHRHARPETAER